MLLLAGMRVRDVVDATGFARSTVHDLDRRLRGLGSPADAASLLSDAPGRGRPDPLAGDAGERLLDEVGRRNFFDLGEIRSWLLEELGVSACVKTISRFLHAHGVRKLKAGSLPAKADPAAQREFWEGTLSPLLAEAREGLRSVLFVDASHFVLGCDFLGSVWCRSRRFLRTFSGRQRHNVLGALDYATHSVTKVTNDAYVNAQSVIELIDRVAEAYGTEAGEGGAKVTMVMDNAAYQRCEAVRDHAEGKGVELLFLPPYSPALNLIERLWKFVKSELRKESWQDFAAFSARIDELVDSTTGENAGRIATLIADNVQLFDGYPPVCEGIVERPPRKAKRTKRTS